MAVDLLFSNEHALISNSVLKEWLCAPVIMKQLDFVTGSVRNNKKGLWTLEVE